jgi:hypothetical protein
VYLPNWHKQKVKHANPEGATSGYYTKLQPYYKPQDEHDETLVFESRFECGNLDEAYQVDDFEYNLYLKPDTNTDRHQTWYFFRVSNTRKGCTYLFNINNNEKKNSNYLKGMKPLFYSLKKNKGWQREGTNIFYF